MTDAKILSSYTPLQRRLHWWVAGLVLAQYAMQDWLVAAMERVRSGEDVEFSEFLLTNLHMLIGAVVAYLVVVRLRLRRQMMLGNPPQPPLKLVQRLALWVHRSIYAVLLGMVASGALHYYADWSVAAQLHEWGKWLLGVLILVHLAGAMAHYWQQRT